MSKKELIDSLAKAVEEGNIEEATSLPEESIKAGYDPLEVLNGVTSALKEVGGRFGRGEMFLTELMFSAEAAKAAMGILSTEIEKQGASVPSLGRVLMGTVAGDIHDIGKSLVTALLTADGFEVIDLGVDVPDEVFVEKVRELEPDVVGMSALVSNTMFKFGDVVDALKAAGLRDNVKVLVGGAFVDEEWAERSGADGMGSDAVDAVAKTRQILGIK
jgi:corrinoid protein of di/trimethylamine methyltransferase